MRREADRGLFVTFEGIEGCGKTTQARRLYRFLKNKGIPCLLTKEPGGTKRARSLRTILLAPRGEKLSEAAEVFLYLADRAQHVEEVIRPALQAGKVVLCDRYSDATFAYQGGGRGHPLPMLIKMDRMATGGLVPDLTFLLDLPVKMGLSRARKRHQGEDRIESESIRFHEKVRKAYLGLEKKSRGRTVILEGIRPIPEIQKIIREQVASRFEKS